MAAVPTNVQTECKATRTLAGPTQTVDEANHADSGTPTAAKKDDGYPPLNLNYEALAHVATYYLPGNHGKCTRIEPLTQGTYHEILTLTFEDGWSCIGRFGRNLREHLCVLESEYATVKYVMKHTTIPAPEVYFVNFNPCHVVGAPFVLTERLEGKHLYELWDRLSLKHKTVVVEQIADVLVQLASLKFDTIGSLTLDGTVGRLQNQTFPEHHHGKGPFDSPKDWFMCFLELQRAEEIMKLYSGFRAPFLEALEYEDNSYLQAPYLLIHGDFDAQNLIFTTSDSAPPQLSGVIDWDWSYTGPLYYLLEYPIFIQDVSWSPDKYNDNKILRKHFVQTLAQSYPKASCEREEVREVFRQKSYTLNSFADIFMRHLWDNLEMEKSVIGGYVRQLTDDNPDEFDVSRAYGGRWDYEPDSELGSDSGDDVDEDTVRDVESESDEMDEVHEDEGGQEV